MGGQRAWHTFLLPILARTRELGFSSRALGSGLKPGKSGIRQLELVSCLEPPRGNLFPLVSGGLALGMQWRPDVWVETLKPFPPPTPRRGP